MCTVSHNLPHKISEIYIFKKMWTTNKVTSFPWFTAVGFEIHMTENKSICRGGGKTF